MHAFMVYNTRHVTCASQEVSSSCILELCNYFFEISTNITTHGNIMSWRQQLLCLQDRAGALVGGSHRRGGSHPPAGRTRSVSTIQFSMIDGSAIGRCLLLCCVTAAIDCIHVVLALLRSQHGACFTGERRHGAADSRHARWSGWDGEAHTGQVQLRHTTIYCDTVFKWHQHDSCLVGR